MTPLPDYSEALAAALACAVPIEQLESLALAEASGRVIAEAIVADRDLPPFDRAEMDGYALRFAELAVQQLWPVAARIAAGAPAIVEVAGGQCVAIATGAPIPAGLDTIIQDDLSDRGDPVRFQLAPEQAGRAAIAKGQAVHRRGADASAGDVLVPAGTMLQSHHLGIAAAVGRAAVTVRRRPQAIVLTSGDEVVDVDRSVQPHQIRNSNGPMVTDLLRRMGAEPLGHRHVADDGPATLEGVASALERTDLLITIGGISAGDRDFFPAAFERVGVKAAVQGASLQPGRPIFVGRAPGGTVVVGLPGNPVSALACSCLFIWPLVRALLGADPQLPWREVALSDAVNPNPKRRAFRPATLVDSRCARVPRWSGSGDLVHTASTHGLAELPVQVDPVAAGATVRLLPWP